MATRDTARTRPGHRSQHADRRSDEPIVDRLRRLAAGVFGSVLVALGARRRSLRGFAMALLGGWLLFRALGGRDRLGRTLRSRPTTGNRRDHGTDAAEETAVTRTVTVGKPADELYEAWRDPDRFSRVMGHFAEVTSTDGDRFRWTVHGPRGMDVSWETHVVEEEPGEFVRWETPEDSMLPNEGTVRFSPASGDRGTVVTLSLRFDPPGGAFGDAVLDRLDVVPETLAGTALHRFKSLAETGEIQTLEGNPSARGTGDLV